MRRARRSGAFFIPIPPDPLTGAGAGRIMPSNSWVGTAPKGSKKRKEDVENGDFTGTGAAAAENPRGPV